MDLNSYQAAARRTAIYPNLGQNITYPTLGLCGEAGEVAEKIKKILRDQEGKIGPDERAGLLLELGDVLWYISQLASELGLPLQKVAQANLDKLAGRAQRDRLGGSGDNR